MLKSVGSRGNTPVSSSTNLHSGSSAPGVDDQQVAKLAVQVVVAGSKKGISTLCADVAQIMRDKLRFERENQVMRKELSSVKGEVEMLRTMLSAAQQQLQESSGSSGYNTLVDEAQGDNVTGQMSPSRSNESVSQCHCYSQQASCDGCQCHEHSLSCKHCCFCSHLSNYKCCCEPETPRCTCYCHQTLSSTVEENNSCLSPTFVSQMQTAGPFEDFVQSGVNQCSTESQTDSIVIGHQPVITIDASCQTKLAPVVPDTNPKLSKECQVNLSYRKPSIKQEDVPSESDVQGMQEDQITSETQKKVQFKIPSVKIQSDMSTQSDKSVNATRKFVQATASTADSVSQTEKEEYQKFTPSLGTRDSNAQTDLLQMEQTASQTGSDLIRTFHLGTQTPPKVLDSQFCQTNIQYLMEDKWCQFPLLQGQQNNTDLDWETPRHLIYEPPFARTPLVTIEVNSMSKLSQTVQSSIPVKLVSTDDPVDQRVQSNLPKSKSMPKIKTSTPTRQASPVKFVDSTQAYQSPQQVLTGRKSVSKTRTPATPVRHGKHEDPVSSTDAQQSGFQFTFGSYEGPKPTSKPSKKHLGFKKGKSWENYVNGLPPRVTFPSRVVQHEATTSNSTMSESGPEAESELDANLATLLEPSVLTSPVPLVGCRCEACIFVFRFAPLGPEDVNKDAEKLGLILGEKVKLMDGRSGFIRYVGHIGCSSDPYSVYAGIELIDSG